MSLKENIALLLSGLTESFSNSAFIRLTLSSKRTKSSELSNVMVKPVILKGTALLNFVFRYTTNDITKNLGIDEASLQIETLLNNDFYKADLFTSLADYSLLSNSKGNSRLLRKPASSKALPAYRHDKVKSRLIDPEHSVYLKRLGVVNDDWTVKPAMQDKFRQINRYVELVDEVLKTAGLPDGFTIADMGSGKGYLTFALYDHLVRSGRKPALMLGIELRPSLVSLCNTIAEEAQFGNLRFETGSIQEASLTTADVLIALHACDTATDEAIFRGIEMGSQVIMVAPCCHKQIRKEFNPQNSLKEITRFGILEERQAEMVTDAISALLLEAYGYKTRVFEFIETEHTPKNVMISAVRHKNENSPSARVFERIGALKAMFGITSHHLEVLLNREKKITP